MFSSSNSLRLVAVAVALIVAVLTGAATGLISGAPDCPAVPASTATTPPAAPTTASGGAGIGDSVGGGGAPEAPPKQQPTAAAAVVQAAQPACTAREPFGVTAALTGFVGALLVGAALLLLLLLSSRGGPRQVQVPVAARGNGTGPADADRRALVQACIYVRDRVTSKALGDRLGAALAEAGVKTLEPTGVRFDPAHHEAGGAAPATDPKLIGSIAAVEVPGYLDRDGRVLRAPIVTVYQAARNPGGPTGAHPTVQQPAQHTPSPQPRREQPR
ncbi:nucleotide exchange factor GrpE [Dactylosporangium cerinum]|uniref:Nucleotide exchange factor GrpE n=1 Tax=Dactylosporangium cerinum TaxID=1434730 RepID=A0ABV9W6E8_9ACTN